MQTILASLFEKLNHFIYICDLKSRYSHWLPSFSHFPLPFSGISFQMDYLYPSSCFKQEESKPRDTAFHSTSFQWWHKSWEKTVVMVLSFWLGANVPHFDLHKNCFRKGKKNLKKPPQLLAYFLNVILVCSPLHAFNVQVLHFVSLLIHMWFKHCGAEEILLGSCAPCYHCVLPASLCTEYIVLNNRKIDTYVDYLWLYVFLSV